jgi:hypothetical protein
VGDGFDGVTGPGHLGLWKRKRSIGKSAKQDGQVISFELGELTFPRGGFFLALVFLGT